MSFRLRIRRLRYHVSSLCTGFVQSLLACTTRSSTTMGGPSTITFLQDATHILTGELSPVRRASVTVTMSESLSPSADRSSTTIGGPLQASLGAVPCAHRQGINTLSDDVLLEIFDLYVNYLLIQTNGWHTLVHVCQRWRHVVFASPRRLNLRLEYTGKRPMSEMLDVWPILPVVISYGSDLSTSWENVAVALESEHRHRICQINLRNIPTSAWKRLAAAMQKPFPELSHLVFWAKDNTVTPLPDSFLGGYSPLLRLLWLDNCPFPGVPKLLLSSNQLVVLDLFYIPNSGYISPQDLVTALSVLSRLETLRLQFQSPRYPASRPRRPLTRSVLPVFTRLAFRGVHEYLEDLLAQIEAPLLTTLYVTFFMDIDFVLPQLHRLISQVESFNSCDRATVRISGHAIRFTISSGTNQPPDLSLKIICSELGSQFASLAQVCSSTFPFLSTLVNLDFEDDVLQSHWKDVTETTPWLELLAPFTAMKDLRLTHQAAPHVCQALEELAGERVTEILPALQNIFLEGLGPLGSVPKYIEGFVAARKHSGHPVAVQGIGPRQDR
ncbi:hypothetical protein F5148DRAFT_386959 [Russula earlei]|uniref:Uncharacterized protein n=1 Tax=Russula earlei TaxID=71964 RepID=A0ACC0U0Q9_9AGAM|nr:hypothetical protein F5148DRAFT_386959 [Russula earlei]